ncbi:MAG: SRPBCC family protein, partial [Angustibacter sp.]
PKSGPKAKFTFTKVESERSIADESPLPLCRLVFDHFLEPTATGTQIRHTVTMTGPLAKLWGRLIGKTLTGHTPEAMRCLARLAESATGD